MTAKHTPGEWRSLYDPFDIFNEDDSKSSVPNWSVSNGEDADLVCTDIESESHARLIAAAPEMLAALEDCADELEEDVRVKNADQRYPQQRLKLDRDMLAVNNARAIIAKAKGES